MSTPSKKDLVEAVRALLKDADLSTVSAKQIRYFITPESVTYMLCIYLIRYILIKLQLYFKDFFTRKFVDFELALIGHLRLVNAPNEKTSKPS